MPTAARSAASSSSSSAAMSPQGGALRPVDQREKRAAARNRGRRRLGAWAAIDPRARWAREWDRAYLLACAAGLMVDPLFLYAVSLSGPLMCVYLDGWFLALVTALRCMVDAVHAWNLLMRLRMAFGPDQDEETEEDADGQEATKLQGSSDAVGGAAAPAQLPRSKRGGLFLDLFVVLPVMQVRACGGDVGGHPGDDPRRVDDVGDDGAHGGLPVRVPAQDLPLLPLPPPDAERLRLRLRHHLVGHRAQPHGILRRRPRGGRVLVPARGAAGHQVPEGAALRRAQRVRGHGAGVRSAALLLRRRHRRGRGRRGGRGQARLGRQRQRQGDVPRQRRQLRVRGVQVDGDARGQPQLGREDSPPDLLGPHDPQYLREPGEHDGVVGDRVQHRHHHRRAHTRHHAHRQHQGVPERDDVEEAGDAHAAAERGVVDEAQEPAAELPAPGAAVRAAAVGGHPRRRRVPHRARPPGGPPPGHQVPPLPRPRPAGAAVPAHGRPGPREHLRQGQVPRLPQRRSDRERRRPRAEDAVHRAGAPAEQPGAADRGDELLHAGARQLQRGRAAILVPTAALPGAAAGVLLHAGHAREHGGVRAGGGRRQVRDAALPLHLRQRQGAAERALLLARLADLGRRGGAARVATVQAPQDAHLAVVHPAAQAAVPVLVAGGGEAAALHRAAHLAQARPGRVALVLQGEPATAIQACLGVHGFCRSFAALSFVQRSSIKFRRAVLHVRNLCPTAW